MKYIATFLYRLYQLFIVLPLFIVLSIITATVTVVGCRLGNGHFWGYYPGKIWARITCYLLFLPVHVEGRENLDPKQSYVFVANHQGAFDIFLIYGFLNRNFKWMMKKSLRKVPFLGVACEYAHHIYVDRSGASKIRKTYDNAREILREGMSLVVFPEGARTFTGHMGKFRRGAFMLASELQLPVCPLTINGSFNVKPRTKDFFWVFWHPMSLTIHKPIPYKPKDDHEREMMAESYDAVMSGLTKEYQGYVENPDQ
ncbi:lysophospholipid acyltransferase family protein [Prevotella lacticifex]|uniref:1-acyl-sn-glycerol-3-phosphate acyltransferase n=1 Tax=Prevotella lacticifex TaxID=2854755 RepID=A0A9R1CVW1_9BACT|nr:lysophospholipid acyltransferase family protein [Prevotella lacticifex]GJG35144.1 1-acyl-sn-glycerol-3-phosphate acyltransferase [Prevotella lacticifex]GJG39805.1 1-acyl-sn-glycerol-3-phosphate acyltransferase [Prevotella lacticifex]GJG41513.1 1-acyl-sn-glycerol-3-phosphate acyltransferase [Prevotella lacticifex]GJG46160.1 1-acyl-sn-glycerol-3-phosphate acyltransferase [Prevotella lacticifex]GJG47864.1 1-acyl-sn-glycerol-3-phosphate acyltransferase [Prevotella lacticifex]